jgi:tetratricopeptide (TPR) repeat protein
MDVQSDALALRHCPVLQELRSHAIAERIEAELHLGRHTDVLPELRQFAREHPLREKVQQLLMIALHQSGQRADALAAFQRARQLLRDELGVEPGEELCRLQQLILHGEPTVPLGRGFPQPGPATSPAAPRQLPAPARYFVGRQMEQGTLDRLADLTGIVPIAVLCGTAGVGKTALAVNWAHRAAARFPDGQLFVDLGGFGPTAVPVTATQAMRRLLVALHVPAHRIPGEHETQGGLLRSLLAGRKVLLVIDNAASAHDVRPLLPASPGCMAVVTSRNELTSLVVIEGAQAIHLDQLDMADARMLITARLGVHRLERELKACDTLIELCARLPLALSIAAARLDGAPIESLTAKLRNARERMDALDTDDTASSVRAVFSWSYERLSASAARLFRLIGVHCGPDISSTAAASLAGVTASEAARLLRELATAHMLAEHTQGRFAPHDLLRDYAAELAYAQFDDAERRTALQRMLDHYLHTGRAAAVLCNPGDEPINLPPTEPGVTLEQLGDARQAMGWFEAERKVLSAALAQAASNGFDFHAWQIASNISIFLRLRGYWDDWAASSQIAIGAARRLGDLRGLAGCYLNLGGALTRLDRFPEAESSYRIALDLYWRLGDQTGHARVYSDLSWSSALGGRIRDAIAHAEAAILGYESAGYQEGEARATALLGWYHALGGDCRHGVYHCQRGLQLCRETGAPLLIAEALDYLGYAQFGLGEPADAILSYHEALELRNAHGDRVGAATTLEHLGDAHDGMGHTEAAHSAWQNALAILHENRDPAANRVRSKLK